MRGKNLATQMLTARWPRLAMLEHRLSPQELQRRGRRSLRDFFPVVSSWQRKLEEPRKAKRNFSLGSDILGSDIKDRFIVRDLYTVRSLLDPNSLLQHVTSWYVHRYIINIDAHCLIQTSYIERKSSPT